MPELPEVECVRRFLAHELTGARLIGAKFYRSDLREPIPVEQFKSSLKNQIVESFSRRSKYLLWNSCSGSVGIFHLGMSGQMLLFDQAAPRLNHTHAVFTFKNTLEGSPKYLHFVDPRRFGRISVSTSSELERHPYLQQLGPEPLGFRSLGQHLFSKSRTKTQCVKNFLMDQRNVVGVGNIYANEALFWAGVDPRTVAGKLSQERYERLGEAISATLNEALEQGGTSLKDFINPDGKPGYFRLRLAVYARAGKPCLRCDRKIISIRQQSRSSFYCPRCQR